MMFAKKKITTPHTMEMCQGCGMLKKRRYARDDVLFAEKGRCDSCGGTILVEMIFGETEER